MTVKDFLLLREVLREEDAREWMNELPKPLSICGKIVPDTLDDLTIGELIELQNIGSDYDVSFKPCMILFGLPEIKVREEEASKIYGLFMWVTSELERINKLFAKTSIAPTSEETQAGIEELQFGMFGLIDHYATRMGITDHECVERVPWVRVWKCLDMDAQRAKFQRRLQKILANK